MTLSRRRKPRTTVGKLVRHWPRIRLAIRVARFVAKARIAIQAALFTLVIVAIARIARRRRRRGTEPLTSYAPPPVSTTAPRPDTPVNGTAPTETERRLHAEK
jgi:hypothetical protein